jgi:hypothetical protein
MREIRSSGSVRGVRSNPYPYRDETLAGAKHRTTPKRMPLTARHEACSQARSPHPQVAITDEARASRLVGCPHGFVGMTGCPELPVTPGQLPGIASPRFGGHLALALT